MKQSQRVFIGLDFKPATHFYLLSIVKAIVKSYGAIQKLLPSQGNRTATHRYQHWLLSTFHKDDISFFICIECCINCGVVVATPKSPTNSIINNF
jgi:hypothetical protein